MAILIACATGCGSAPQPKSEAQPVVPLDIGGLAEWAHDFTVEKDGREIGSAAVSGKRVGEGEDLRFRLDLRVDLASGERIAERQEFSLREPYRVVFAQYFEGKGNQATRASEIRKGPIGYKAQQFDGSDKQKFDVNRPPYTLVDALAGRSLAAAGEVGAQLRTTTLVTKTIEAIPTVWRGERRDPSGIVVVEKRLEPEGATTRSQRFHFDGARLIRIDHPDGTTWK